MELHTTHPFVGRHVIARCSGAGVHAGTLAAVSSDGTCVILKNARRLWKWHARGGIALSGVAVHGLVAEDSILDTPVSEIYLTGVVELIPTTPESESSINEA